MAQQWLKRQTTIALNEAVVHASVPPRREAEPGNNATLCQLRPDRITPRHRLFADLTPGPAAVSLGRSVRLPLQTAPIVGLTETRRPYIGCVPIDYSSPGRLTTLDVVPGWALEPVAWDPVAICAPVHALVVQPTDPFAAALPADRLAENHVRPAAGLVALLLRCWRLR